MRITSVREDLVSKWQRAPTPLKWIVGLLIAALGAAITAFVQDGIQSLPERLQRPLEISVTVDRDAFKAEWFGNPTYVIPEGTEDISIPPGRDEPYGDRQKWAEKLGGVDGYSTDVQVVIRGRTEEPVILTSLKINVLKKEPPIEGVAVKYCECGDAIPERIMSLDLTASPPKVIQSVDYRKDDPSKGKPVDFPYRVSNTEPEVFYITGSAEEYTENGENIGCYCEWTMELFYSVGDRVESVILENEGEPFRTTGVPPDAKVRFSNDGYWCTAERPCS